LIDSDDDDLLCSTGFAVLRSKKDISDPRFIFQAINSEVVERQLNALVTGSNYPAVNSGQVAELLIPVPPLPEQKKIAEILSGIDELISLKNKKIQKISLLHNASRQNKVLEIAANSEITSLGAICNKVMDYRGKSPPKSERGVRLITAKNIRMGYISDLPVEFIEEDLYESWMSKGIPSSGDILITTEAPLGNIAMAPLGRFAIGQRVICISADKARILPTYLLAYMKTDSFQDQLTLSSTGSTVSGVRQGVLLDCQIPLPTINAQRIIGEFDNHASKLIRELNRQMNDLIFLKNAMSSDLLSGRKRISV
jgi:type I restriction enzyme S subunit